MEKLVLYVKTLLGMFDQYIVACPE